MNNTAAVAQQLAALGMQTTSGAGWYVVVIVNDVPVRVWATDIDDG